MTLVLLLALPYTLAVGQSTSDVSQGKYRNRVAQLGKHLETSVVRDHFSGVVLIAQNGKPLLERGYGLANAEFRIPNTLETKFRIGSITKQFTATAMLLLQQDGKLRVTDSIEKHVGDIPEHWKGITIRQLLNHTSGLMHSWELAEFESTLMIPTTPEKLLARYKDKPLRSKPGEKFHYSGLGYFILAQIIEKVSGQTYDVFLQKRIFEPLGMENTGCDSSAVLLTNRAAGYIIENQQIRNAPTIYMAIFNGGGNLYSTVEDLLLWDKALYLEKLLTSKSSAEMFTPALSEYGYGWAIKSEFGRRAIQHGGALPGFAAYFLRFPDDKVTIIILSNMGSFNSHGLGQNLAAILFEQRVPAE